VRLTRRYSLTVVVTVFLLLAIGVPTLLAGCQPKLIEPVEPGVNLGYNISRYVDAEAGVVCWVYNASYSGGLACLPISDTRLDQ